MTRITYCGFLVFLPGCWVLMAPNHLFGRQPYVNAWIPLSISHPAAMRRKTKNTPYDGQKLHSLWRSSTLPQWQTRNNNYDDDNNNIISPTTAAGQRKLLLFTKANNHVDQDNNDRMVEAKDDLVKDQGRNGKQQPPVGHDDRTLLETLTSYVSSIQYSRKVVQEAKDQATPPQQHNHHHNSTDTSFLSTEEKQRLLKPAWSLANFLNNSPSVTEQPNVSPDQSAVVTVAAAVTVVSEQLSRAVIQAMRLAASLNDYRLILRLVEVVVPLAGGVLLLDPRILGEAIRALTATSASIAKIKSVWKILEEIDLDVDSALRGGWTRSVGAWEVNTMLEAYIRRGKMGAALDLYRQQQQQQQQQQRTDAYSLSILLNGLKESIPDHGTLVKPALTPPIQLNDKLLISLISPCCWQWNEALQLVDQVLVGQEKWVMQQYLTNPVISALLQLNIRAAHVYKTNHQGSRYALALLELLRTYNISPDAVTCTLIISSLETEWEAAVELLHRMMQRQSPSEPSLLGGGWTLPRPNVYTYSAVMSVCARNQQYAQVWNLLDQAVASANANKDSATNVAPNTWLYNTVLQAVVKSTQKPPSTSLDKRSRQWMIRRGLERMQVAFQLLQRMEYEAESSGGSSNTAPDTVTYNTILTGLAAVAPYLSSPEYQDLELHFPEYFGGGSGDDRQGQIEYPSRVEEIIHCLLQRMKEHNIERDMTTYVHAMQALNSCPVDSIVRLLHCATMDCGRLVINSRLYNTALSVMGSSANNHEMEDVCEVLQLMQENGVVPDAETISTLIVILGVSGKTHLLAPFLKAIQSDAMARDAFPRTFGILFLADCCQSKPSPEQVASAISACLLADDFESAREILDFIKDNDVMLTDSSRATIARAYAVVALSSTSSSSVATAVNNRSRMKQTKSIQDTVRDGQARAESAYAILTKMETPAASLVSIVAKACAATGLFEPAQNLLRLAHKRLLDTRSSQDLSTSKTKWMEVSPQMTEFEEVLPDLHRTLLRSCAKSKNVAAALAFCEDIQYLSKQLSWLNTSRDPQLSPQKPNDDSTTERALFVVDSGRDHHSSVDSASSKLGMNVPEWKALIAAAARSGHWRVCLSTLQFLRPFVEETRPSLARNARDLKRLGKKYSGVSSALVTAVAGLSAAGQYAWAVRIMEDWIHWSGGRRPPWQAVLTVMRLLSSRGSTEEVVSLLNRCVNLPDHGGDYDDDNTSMYEIRLYIGAITALYSDGIYDTADDIFVAAISKGLLPFNLNQQKMGSENRLLLDLHGMNVAVAHSAVRIALQQELLSKSWKMEEEGNVNNDMVIITGRGRNSAFRMRPVLRPAVQKMLVEEFYPPLSTVSVPRNMGALRIPAEDISAWLAYQRQQKGARMIALAEVLKSLSSGRRLRAALSKAATASPPYQDGGGANTEEGSTPQ